MSLPLPRVTRAALHPLGVALHRSAERVRRARGRDYSGLGEEAVIRRLLTTLDVDHPVAIDVAACDGTTKSNALRLYEAGWGGLAVEGDPDRFASLARAYRRFPAVSLARAWVTPENVVPLLRAHGIPREPGFLNLDIDGYDHFALDALLEELRPVLVCAEINEKIPPPLRFTVLYDPEYAWAEDHFYGQSISALHALAEGHGYALVELHYNNAFLVPRERSRLPALTPEEAYARGYLDRPDRHRLFPWNEDMEALHGLDTEAQLAFLRQKFAAYDGKYDLTA